MILEHFSHFKDFELLDTGHGYRLERWGNVILKRPDPQIIWDPSLPKDEWDKTSAEYRPSKQETKGMWEIKKPLPSPWIIDYKNCKFLLKLSPFKHTGLFPEQSAQWDWITKKLPGDTKHPNLKILNLFAYTGGATMVLAKAGCFVTHVDASKPAINWANENHKINNLPTNSVRWILDDAVKFVKRELKRNAIYDGIIMDPPAFGHSPMGKIWKFNDDLPNLLKDCVQLLSKKAKFLVINGYATNSSALALKNLLEDSQKSIPIFSNNQVEFGELCLRQKSSRLISTGIFARWGS